MKQSETIINRREIPFKTTLSFEYLIAEIIKIADQPNHPLGKLALEVATKLEKKPAFFNPIEDYFDFVKDNHELIKLMMSFVFNPLEDDTCITSASGPFHPQPFYTSSMYDNTIVGQHVKIEVAGNTEKLDMLVIIIQRAYRIILNKFYGHNFDIDVPFTFKYTNTKTNRVRYYNLNMNNKFVDIKPAGKLKNLTKDQINDLFENSHNIEYLNSVLPLKNFEFIGFIHWRYQDVTHDHVISQLKSILLDKNSLFSKNGFKKIRNKIRALLVIPDLEVGMTAFNSFGTLINQDVIWESILPKSEFGASEYLGTIFEKAYHEKKYILTFDFEQLEKDKMVNLFLKKGIRSHVVIPLILENKIVGMLELGAKQPEQLNVFKINQLQELLPVFAVALNRSKEELNDRLRAILQEEFTTIHPTVEWRFQEAAHSILKSRLENSNSQTEPIVFENVVPIYGSSDIRGSSIERSRAIQADLIEHLGMAKHILGQSTLKNKMPLIELLEFKTDQHLVMVKEGLKTGDEVSILEFLKNEVEPVFIQLMAREPKDKTLFEAYFEKMDPELKVLYRKRKDFEESVTMINKVVGEILDKEQIAAQQVFPHYFEKYRTDGIEYNAYIGQSLVRNLEYCKIYLKNIRLWQILVKVKIARKINSILPSLKTQLNIRQLILVHSNPLSIAFRQDEKKFDVANTYNIRYEIIKKRIDKAVIKGSQERITQVNKIAIIYSHTEEIEEYRKYIDYLISEKHLKPYVEDLELEDLKGATGLRALRVEVNYEINQHRDNIDFDEIKKFVEGI